VATACGVEHEPGAVALGHPLQARHVARYAEQVRGHDHRDAVEVAVELLGMQAPVTGVDIDEAGPQPVPLERMHRRREPQRRQQRA
jgi:hypothetical protein